MSDRYTNSCLNCEHCILIGNASWKCEKTEKVYHFGDFYTPFIKCKGTKYDKKKEN